MKILVVDDSSTMRRIIVNALAEMGQTDIVQAADGNEAAQAFAEHQDIGLILTDWNMPNMDGLEFLKQIRRDGKELPVVMITTEAEKGNVLTAIKDGANNYVVKPFTTETLREKIESFIAIWHSGSLPVPQESDWRRRPWSPRCRGQRPG